MKNKLPGVYANKNISNLNNNEKVYYSNKDSNKNIKTTKKNKKDDRLPSLIGQSVEQKINTIFNSVNYVYKAKVEITLEDGKVIKNIIGRNNVSLITMDNELIPIDKIIDIEYKK
ncbi:MAG: hypothetical protein PHY33_06705 [Methanobacteriaceae archaeon]|nr:hypothetical protein [Methanobacteriaceae archaeon]